MLVLLLIASTTFIGVYSEPHCNAPKEVGSCQGTEKVPRYYFNYDKRQCMQFGRLECETEEKYFNSIPDCMRRCMPSDGGPCRGGAFQTDTFKIDPQTRSGCPMSGCPQGFTCQYGPFFSTCCNKTIEDWFRQDGPCVNGKQPYKIADSVIVGDSCQDLLCPAAHSCETLNPLFARCCPK